MEQIPKPMIILKKLAIRDKKNPAIEMSNINPITKAMQPISRLDMTTSTRLERSSGCAAKNRPPSCTFTVIPEVLIRKNTGNMNSQFAASMAKPPSFPDDLAVRKLLIIKKTTPLRFILLPVFNQEQ